MQTTFVAIGTLRVNSMAHGFPGMNQNHFARMDLYVGHIEINCHSNLYEPHVISNTVEI